MLVEEKREKRDKRHRRVRKKVRGSAERQIGRAHV